MAYFLLCAKQASVPLARRINSAGASTLDRQDL